MSQSSSYEKLRVYLEDSSNSNGIPWIPMLIYLEIWKYAPYETGEYHSPESMENGSRKLHIKTTFTCWQERRRTNLPMQKHFGEIYPNPKLHA